MKDKNAYIAAFLANDRLGALIGARFVSLSEQDSVYEYDVSPNHFNPGHILHGGALFTVMDSGQGMLMHYILDEAYAGAATGTATIKYLAPLREGTIRIHSVVTGRENRKYFVRSTATDSQGKEVAVVEEIWIGIPGALS